MQHDLNLADQAGAAFRADLNNALSALATNNGGATAPAATYANMWWADEAANILKRRNEANTAWINVMSLTLAISVYSETILVAANAAAALLALGAAPLANPTLTGIPRAPTAAVGTNTTQLATTAFVGAEIASDLVAAGYTTPAEVKSQFNAAGSAPVFACRAWVNFNGTGTVAIRASGNVSSITDSGVGTYVVNFLTQLPSVNYVVSPSGGSGGIGLSPTINGIGTLNFANFSITYRDETGALVDRSICNLSIFN